MFKALGKRLVSLIAPHIIVWVSAKIAAAVKKITASKKPKE